MNYNGRPVLDIRPDFTSVQHGELDDVSIHRTDRGTGTPWKATSHPKRKLKLPFIFATKAEWRTFRDFVADRQGTKQGFWVPIWLTDYPSYQQTEGGNTINLLSINLASVWVAAAQFSYLALISPTAIQPLQIANVTSLGGGNEQITTVETLVGTFDPNSSICCGLMFARFADSAIAYTFISDGVIRADVNFLELPREYAADATTSRPIYLYRFERGNSVWRFCDYGETIVAGDEVWISDNIVHDDIHSGFDFLSESLAVTCGTDRSDHPLRYYLSRLALEKTTLTIFETDADTLAFDETAVLYEGDVIDVGYNANGEIKAVCSSIMRVGELQAPRVQVQRTCNHQTYDANCGLIEADFTTAGFITVVGEDYIEATEFGDKAVDESDPDWFALGKVTIGTEKRMCVGAAGNRLYLDAPFYATPGIGAAVSASAGDNKRIGTCLAKFNNIDHNLSMPYLPSQNPQFTALSLPQKSGGKKG